MKRTVWVISLFPDYFKAFQNFGVVGQALSGERELGEYHFELKLLNLRDYSDNNYKGVDDTPYGGGAGMVMRADILEKALLEGIFTPCLKDAQDFHIIFPAPRGSIWNNQQAKDFCHSKILGEKDLIFICGRYEGADERFLEKYVDQFISVGDYILSGGELAVMAILDSAMRFVPGVLGNNHSLDEESFESNLLEYPVYTKPRVFSEKEVPEVLLSGHHAHIETYKKSERKRMTQKYRPDLWAKYTKDQS